MDLHHRLRRDPNWHPNSCNICGQLDHQAAQCQTGTVNYKGFYGAEAFLMRPPLFHSQIVAMENAKKIDYEKLREASKRYSEAKLKGEIPAANGGAVPAQPAPLAPAQPPIADDLPPGWATAKDAQGKVYYWHRETKKVQWDKPTAPAATAAGDPPPS